jgi:nicotinamidase-related amidase
METAFICIDFINDIIGDGGKLTGKGYGAFARDHEVLEALKTIQTRARSMAIPVIHVRIGFDAGYLSQPKSSPLFGAADRLDALKQGAWGTEYADGVGPADGELSLFKPRVSAFRGTSLESALHALGVSRVVLAGVATDLAVTAAAFDAHDRDYSVCIAEEACAAASDVDHAGALAILAKVATVSPNTTLFE